MATITDVKLDKPVEFCPYYQRGGYASPIDGAQSFIMKPDDAQTLVKSLIKVNKLDLIEESLQSLAVRRDGTILKTAMPLLSEVKASLSLIDSVPYDLLKMIHAWELQGANEIHIDFEARC